MPGKLLGSFSWPGRHVVNHTAAVRKFEITQSPRDDLVAEVFLSWIDKDFAVLRRFRGHSSLATYLTVVARRVIIRRLAQLEIAAPIGFHRDVDSGLLSQFDGLSNEDREELEQGLLLLSSKNLRSFACSISRLSYREIASRTGMQENSIGRFCHAHAKR